MNYLLTTLVLTFLVVTFQKPVTCKDGPLTLENVMFEQVNCNDRRVCFVQCGELVEGCQREAAFEVEMTNEMVKAQFSRMCTQQNREYLALEEFKKLQKTIPQLKMIVRQKGLTELEELCRETKRGNTIFVPSPKICSPLAIFRVETLLKNSQRICEEKPEMA